MIKKDIRVVSRFSIVIITIIGFTSIKALSGQLRVGTPEQIYPTQQTGFPCDAVPATVYQNDGTLKIYLSTVDKVYEFTGTPDHPYQNRVNHSNGSYFNPLTSYAKMHTSEYYMDFGTAYYDQIDNAVDNVGLYFKNIYKVSDNELLGFVHAEYYYQKRSSSAGPYPAYFAIGVCYSNNNGVSWNYCGDIIRPNKNYDGVNKSTESNIGGVPCITVGEYFHVYYNEHTGTEVYPSVARAKIDDVVAKAKNGEVEDWKKWTGNDSWNADADGGIGVSPGIGMRVIPENVINGADVHSDAAFCTVSGQYYLTVCSDYRIYVIQSRDGLSWNKPVLLADNNLGRNGSISVCPVFVSIKGKKSDDNMRVGSAFYIYFNSNYPSPLNGCYEGDNNATCMSSWRRDNTDMPVWRVRVDVRSGTSNLLLP